MGDRAKEKIEYILENHKSEPLRADMIAELNRILAKAEARLGL